ncbi:AAA family ATPase [Acutalibacter sp. 1XD8-33]|uniref:ATP-binding protein n=1 Tax=Acutalibacter sp. 1XD8-33 TaxID=2320081 RepID=UPI000EA162C0|nr:AAA family ATPase [Acutalibacter sp. 1XD8-33]RKJ40556.1 AAA family ATPase [Acutalibacter sp. 1XD8-33]
MNLKIIFYKSSSKYYDSVCLQCENFVGYSCEKSANTLVLGMEEIRQCEFEIKGILETIRNWTKTEYFIDEERATLTDINTIFTIVDCEAGCSSCIHPEEYCYENAGWGCKSLDLISLRKDSYYSYRLSNCWYEFGHFENNVWNIDKEQILFMLQKEVKKKKVNICKHFSYERLQKALDTLPNIIEVTEDGDWEYKYRNAPLGMRQSEIIGVKPREKREKDYRSPFSLSLFEDKQEIPVNDTKYVPTTTFKDIGGLDEIVQQVREVIELPLIAPYLFEHYRIKPHKGILLYGPPGCGKTLIAKAIANEISAHFVSVSGPEILNKFIGQSEANLRKIFEEAKKMRPAIIYFDEFDSISSTRDADGNPLMATVVNQLLTLLDGIDENSRICAIASTNRIDMIDDAIKRPGRFDYVIEIQKPSLEGCKAIFRIHTENMPVAKDFDKNDFVEEWLVGCSGAEIDFVVSEAAYNSIRRTVDIGRTFEINTNIDITDKNVIVKEDFVKAAITLKESRARAETAKWRY